MEAAELYARQVISGEIVAGKYERLACERHFRDLENGHERGLYFDPDDAQFVLDFFGLLQHSKGKWAGTPVVLEPWQAFIIACVFGWKNADGTRRFCTAYEEVARKNGKSTKLSGLALYALVADDEAGSEVYTAATKKDQAKITFDEAARMASSSKALAKRVKQVKNNLSVASTASKLEPLGADSKKLDGLNVHFGLVDELHAHRTSGVWDVLESAMGARSQPLLWAITTAGFNKLGFCYQQRDYAIKVLEGLIDDDSFFGIIFALDKDDDWKDETVWRKANPNLGVSVSLDYLRKKCRKARELPSAKVNFLTKYLNMWTDSSEAWIDTEKFEACIREFGLEEFEGARVFGGFDLASVRDITAFAILCKRGEEIWAKLFFYLPEETAKARWLSDQIPYPQWAEKGFITLTPGEVCDYDYLKADICKTLERFDVVDIGFDTWNSTHLTNDLMDEGAPLTKVIQGFHTMNSAMRDFERSYIAERFYWDGNPVLRWMAGNLMVKLDEAGNMKPDRKNSREKIDGFAAIFNAIARLMANDADGPSVYEDREMDVF